MRLPLAVLLLAASLPAGADIYKWTDENGRVHFGDSAAGAGKPATAVQPAAPARGGASTGAGASSSAGSNSSSSSHSSAGSGAPGDSRSLMERQKRISDVLQQEEAARQQAAREQAQQQARTAADCERLRHQLESMEGRAVYIPGPDGERQFMDDAQRKDYVDKANALLAEHCR